jgi:DNA-binding NarL/FixJ family response regulator
VRKGFRLEILDNNKKIEQALSKIAEIASELSDSRKLKLQSLISQARFHTQTISGIVNASVEELSKQELNVRDLIVLGYSNKQIANHLNTSEKTIKFHITNIYKKLGVRDRGMLIAEYYLSQKKIVQMPPITNVLKKEIPQAPMTVFLPKGQTK